MVAARQPFYSVLWGKRLLTQGLFWCLEASLAPSRQEYLVQDVGTCLRSWHYMGSLPSGRLFSTLAGSVQDCNLWMVIIQYLSLRIFNMSDEKINERSDFLIQFLDLPNKWRLVMNLSGGQQR